MSWSAFVLVPWFDAVAKLPGLALPDNPPEVLGVFGVHVASFAMRDPCSVHLFFEVTCTPEPDSTDRAK